METNVESLKMQTVEAFFLLVRASISQEKPEKVSLPEIHHGFLLSIAKKTHTASLLFSVLGENGVPDDILPEWRKTVRGDFLKDVRQTEALENLYEGMTEEGFSVIPLKGCILKSYYPSPEMRFMSDIDLLYKGEEKKLFPLMERLGYQGDSLGGENHHVFSIKPWVKVEQHFALGRPEIPLMDVLSSCWDRAVADSERTGIFHLSDSDFYLHMVAHALKHAVNGGLSIRTILDFALFKRRKPDTIEDGFVRNAIRKAGLEVFEKRILHYAEYLSSEGIELSEPDRRFLYKALGTGLFGSAEGKIGWKMTEEGANGKSRSRYFLSRVFPPLSYMSSRFGGKKYGWIFYPAVWLKRCFNVLFHPSRRKNLTTEWKSVNRIDSETVRNYRDEKEYFGLSRNLSIPDD